MDLKLQPFNLEQALSKAGMGSMSGVSVKSVGDKTPLVSGGGFQDALNSALADVSGMQNESKRLQQELQIGNPKVSMEQTMISMQKSQVGFQAVVSVRNRLMQAYTEVMNMQV